MRVRHDTGSVEEEFSETGLWQPFRNDDEQKPCDKRAQTLCIILTLREWRNWQTHQT